MGRRLSGNGGRGATISPGAVAIDPAATGAVTQLRAGLKGTLSWTKLSGAGAVAVANGGAVSLSTALGTGGSAAAVVRVANSYGDAIERAITLTATGAAAPAPAFTVQPSITPGSGAAGTTFTAGDGTASNVTGYTRRWILSGAVIGTGATIVPGAAGSLVLEVTASGPGGATTASSAAVTVSAAASGTALPQASAILARWSADAIPAQADNSAVATWGDSVGGLAAAQGTASAQPRYRTGGLGGKPYLSFSGAQRLDIPSGALLTALQGGGSTSYVVYRNPASTAVLGQMFGPNIGNTAYNLFATGTKAGVFDARQQVPLTPTGGMESVGYASGNTGAPYNGHLYLRGCRYNNWSAQRLSGSATGLSIGGNATQAWGFIGEIYEIVVWNRVLTAAEMMQAEKWARDKYGQPYPWAGQPFRVFDGDSITNGDQTSAANKHYPAQLAAARGWPIGTWCNLGRNGANWAIKQADAVNDIDPMVALLGATPLHLHAFEYFNNAGGQSTATSTQNGAIAYLQARRAAGAARIVFGSSTDAGNSVSGYTESVRAAYNAWAAANWATYADAFAAIHANANIGVDGAAPNASPGGTYFANDLIHLVDAGYGELAGVFSAQIP